MLFEYKKVKYIIDVCTYVSSAISPQKDFKIFINEISNSWFIKINQFITITNISNHIAQQNASSYMHS